MRNRNPRRGDRWDDRDRLNDFYDRGRARSSDEGRYRLDDEYSGQREFYGSDPRDRSSSRMGRDYGREERDRYDRYDRPATGRGRGYNDKTDSWIGRSNFETGFTGWGTNKYDHGQYDPYWTSSGEEHDNRNREMNRRRHWWDKAADEVASWFGDDEAERRRQMDYRREGDFRGRGPKGYTRSDERIRDDLNDRLTDDYALDASDIEVEVNNGDVVLTGTVESRYEKRRAEDVAESVSGVRNVENRIRVSDYSRQNFAAENQADYNTDRTAANYLNGRTSDDRSRGVGGTT